MEFSHSVRVKMLGLLQLPVIPETALEIAIAIVEFKGQHYSNAYLLFEITFFC